MNTKQWISKINSISDSFLLNKQHILTFINLISSKYLTLVHIDFPIKIKNIIKHKDYILIWDCEFQVFKSPRKYKCNKTQFETTNGQKMIRCISEIGIILILNINNSFYLAGLFHCAFLNMRLSNDISDFTPYYHEYMSIQKKSLVKIIDIEQNIYPHLKFEKIWNNFIKHKNSDLLSQDIIKLTSNKILRSSKYILSTFNKQILKLIPLIQSLPPFNDDIVLTPDIIKLIDKIIDNLKIIIYNNTISQFNKHHHSFKKILKIYLNDKYIQNILVNIDNHKSVMHNLNLIISDINCLNIVKGQSDIIAVINHNLFLNRCHNSVSNNNIIDIADYNNKIHELCSSAKLYESYVCLSNKSILDNEKYKEESILNFLKKYMDSDFKPHNPLVDAYYTLQVFIFFNLLNKYI